MSSTLRFTLIIFVFIFNEISLIIEKFIENSMKSELELKYIHIKEIFDWGFGETRISQIFFVTCSFSKWFFECFILNSKIL
jgi:hypothetical protein